MPPNLCQNAAEYLRSMQDLIPRLERQPIDALTDEVHSAWLNGRQVLVFGNGGSAYTASHFVTDLVKMAAVEGRPHLRAISLCDNYGITTAVGNDIAYADTFLYPMQAYAQEGDLAIAISGSGNSPNVVKACRWAKDHGLRVACLTGFDGGTLRDLAHIHVHIPSDNYGLIEDLHLSINHIVAQAFRVRVSAAVKQEVLS